MRRAAADVHQRGKCLKFSVLAYEKLLKICALNFQLPGSSLAHLRPTGGKSSKERTSLLEVYKRRGLPIKSAFIFVLERERERERENSLILSREKVLRMV